MTVTIALIERDEEKCRRMVQTIKKALQRGEDALAVYTFSDERVFLYAFAEKRFRVDILALHADDMGYALGRRLRSRDQRCVIIYYAETLDTVLSAFASLPIAYLVSENNAYDWQSAFRLAYSHLLDVSSAQNTQEDTGAQRFRHQTKFNIINLPYHEIDCFESALRRIIVHKTDLSTEGFPGKLDDVQSRCLHSFYRSHQSYLVNLRHIALVDKTERRIQFYSGNEAFISRQEYSGFLEEYLRMQEKERAHG